MKRKGKQPIMKTKKYVDYILQVTQELLAIDSPTGYTDEAVKFIMNEYEKLGYKPEKTTKGGVIVDLGGKQTNDGLMLAAHTDTLGGMVCEIKGNGRLRVSPLGGMNANNAETENVRIITKFDGIYEGTFQLDNASVHVNGEYNSTKRDYSGMEVVIDENVKSAEDTRKLGIENGDIICFDPRTVITKSGYIKSRFLDDKLSVGILLGFAKYLRDEKKVPERRIYHHITVYEEVGHGGAASLPDGVTEMISVDMGCVGDGLKCDERMVSICAKDSMGPYNYETVKKLVEAAKKEKLSYAVDVYPYYGSDVDVTLKAGYDIRHGLIGAGVYASHGYERSHRDGVKNTFALLVSYIL
jgi:putative aminopeptidase FrvX